MDFKHISVLYEESIAALNVRNGGLYVDGTLGGGGHSYGILSGADCSLIGIDQDTEAISAASERLKKFDGRFTAVNNNFCNIKSILAELNVSGIDGALLDIGVSSYQLDNPERGFSYMHDAPLDMRMNARGGKTASDVVNTYSVEELTRIFYEYGEERWSKRVAEFIAERRGERPVETTFELVDIIKAAIPQRARSEGGHPAKRIFQAIRIEVNDELEVLKKAIADFTDCLNKGGRLAIITFHSLEDRIVKQAFADKARGCICPKEFPVCVCGRKPEIKIISRKPVLPSKEETERNPRSKSAKLRVAEKL
ncbi:MAG: 16S rRNA (cytosine(1402)-N(4))-methyltransferase RsmH [Clostridia bacterium]|nr:16S rRNA (cytosine(1402)-N(4))-methyltransferase RsmH [Clostridia bacterium]